ncbi:MAG: methionine synthase [Candidatus Auribacterota bacterium]|nr:methionine synthase [Candidatus Auribacterota bacterium]
MNIRRLLKEKILLLDGAMGTMIQAHGFSEEDFRGKRFLQHPHDLKGNYDILNLTYPDIIQDIHRQYLDAGADIVETNTFNGNRVSQSDYGTEDLIYEINKSGAEIARRAVTNSDKAAFVAGVLGPTNQTTSLSPDLHDPAFRNITFNQLVADYSEAIQGLSEGGVDLFLVETIFDPLNAKAAVYAISQFNKESGRDIPFIISGTISDQSGRFLTGMTPKAFYYSLIHSHPMSIGLNCSLGADTLIKYLRIIAEEADCAVNVHPNAGMPNELGEYDESPARMAEEMRVYCEESLVNIVGGCCGTTPRHIRAIAEIVKNYSPRIFSRKKLKHYFTGLETLKLDENSLFVNIGERTNVAGSRKFLRLISEKTYEEALEIARQQVKNGAQILDINMDDALLDTQEEMVHFVNLLVSEPDVARIPFMFDSSKFKVGREALAACQGRGIVNSISLKGGREKFVGQAHEIIELGGAFIVMAFDENGQAGTYERKIEICRRAYNILVKEEGISRNNIIFDPNVFAIGTGIEEHADYGIDFIKAIRYIKTNLPGVLTSGGISNISFSFRGNNEIREAIHSVFLYHAIQAGLDMGIVNPGMITVYDEVPEDLRQTIEDLLFNRREDATERMLDMARKIKGTFRKKVIPAEEWRKLPLEKRLSHALVTGITTHIKEDMKEAIHTFSDPLDIIEGPLMAGMNKVGELFGSGKMFLPQVVKSARVMKESVSYVMPLIKEEQSGRSRTNGVIVLATVKGDVHDIGKNIVNVVLACNNFEIHDLGVMVSNEDILRKAKEVDADLIGLSGLITPSLEEMKKFAELLTREKINIPIMIGGATTSKIHTALKLDPFYEPGIVYVPDASRGVETATNLSSNIKREAYIHEVKEEYARLREAREKSTRKVKLINLTEARRQAFPWDWKNYTPPRPNFTGITDLKFDMDNVIKLIDWNYFFKGWEVKGRYPEILDDPDKGEEARKLFSDGEKMLARIKEENLIKLWARIGIHPANSKDDTIEVYQDGRLSCELPMLRQQTERKDAKYYLSLADYIAPKYSGKKDYIGAFACTAEIDIEKSLSLFAESDDYSRIMLKLLATRLAEALAEEAGRQVRQNFWGYAFDENLSVAELLRSNYQGIRPAPGYSACPDHTEKKKLFHDLLGMDENSPIQLTENFLMVPVASVCGYYFAHPESRYFSIGKIDEEQFEDYRKRKGKDREYLLQMLALDVV